MINGFIPAISSYERTLKIVKSPPNDSKLKFDNANSLGKGSRKLKKSDSIDKSLLIKHKTRGSVYKVRGEKGLRFSRELEKYSQKINFEQSKRFSNEIGSFNNGTTFQAKDLNFKKSMKPQVQSHSISDNLNYNLNQSVKNKFSLISSGRLSRPV